MGPGASPFVSPPPLTQTYHTRIPILISSRFLEPIAAYLGHKTVTTIREESQRVFGELFFARSSPDHDHEGDSQAPEGSGFQQSWASLRRDILENRQQIFCIVALVAFRVVSSFTRKAALDLYGKQGAWLIPYVLGEVICWFGLALKLYTKLYPQHSDTWKEALAGVSAIIAALTDCASLMYLGGFDTHKVSNWVSLVFNLFSESGVHIVDLCLLTKAKQETPVPPDPENPMAKWLLVPAEYRAWALDSLSDELFRYLAEQSTTGKASSAVSSAVASPDLRARSRRVSRPASRELV
ncbi:uncharacterized protein GIQ15_03845 [Arthroderma uncinatum]|uniref:uncharacterized protein n=1 Tax=Arthroderma uncinatum TaxID=74035 RepID=UPI00144A6823|nr:uncharacterized protein GIQ15_03845 [Arthroderma uncinatum]KAF3481086.1 hypothetical protein GIQ15_03845 [Arthroderma uncinatum]